MHAVELARAGDPRGRSCRVTPGVTSALGLLFVDVVHDVSARSCIGRLAELDAGRGRAPSSPRSRREPRAALDADGVAAASAAPGARGRPALRGPGQGADARRSMPADPLAAQCRDVRDALPRRVRAPLPVRHRGDPGRGLGACACAAAGGARSPTSRLAARGGGAAARCASGSRVSGSDGAPSRHRRRRPRRPARGHVASTGPARGGAARHDDRRPAGLAPARSTTRGNLLIDCRRRGG